jgi:uncharacterized membrane protein HdeD (DUF308 family)
MKMLGKIVGLLMLLLGTIWILQGINILPGSFMTGQTQWAVYGALCCAAGIVVLYLSGRAGRRPPGA